MTKSRWLIPVPSPRKNHGIHRGRSKYVRPLAGGARPLCPNVPILGQNVPKFIATRFGSNAWVLLPGHSTLWRLVASARERADVSPCLGSCPQGQSGRSGHAPLSVTIG